MVFGVAQSHVDWLSSHGRRTPAVVVGTDPGCGGEDVPHVDVAFTEFPGVRVTDNLATGGTGCGDFHIGQKVWVYVNPSNPSDAELPGGQADIGTPGWVAFGLILFGLGSCWKGWRQLLGAHRAAVDSGRMERGPNGSAEIPEWTPQRSRETAPGQSAWHSDPWGVAPLRWWDGRQWTGFTSPLAGAMRAASQTQGDATGVVVADPRTSSPEAPRLPGPKSKRTAALLAIFLGWLGIHRFYLGFTGIGLLMLLLTILSAGLLAPLTAVWGIVEGILIIRGTRSYSHDAHGQALLPPASKYPPDLRQGV